jgi:hypothetical protein
VRAGVSYTYDDCIFHPGHIFFSADEARARTLPLACGHCARCGRAAAAWQRIARRSSAVHAQCCPRAVPARALPQPAAETASHPFVSRRRRCARRQVELTTRVTKNIALRTPLVSSPMDTGACARDARL